MDGLQKISGCDRPDRVADVIFVHGLDGDARTTWHPKDRPDAFWPAWLGEDVPAVGVWSLGYAVSASAWKGHTMPLADRATNVLDLLELDGIGRRPIVFICHSLGGLLVKQVLRSAGDFGNPAWKAIATQTKAIVFLSTPHSGADLASWIQYIGGLLRTTVSVEGTGSAPSALAGTQSLVSQPRRGFRPRHRGVLREAPRRRHSGGQRNHRRSGDRRGHPHSGGRRPCLHLQARLEGQPDLPPGEAPGRGHRRCRSPASGETAAPGPRHGFATPGENARRLGLRPGENRPLRAVGRRIGHFWPTTSTSPADRARFDKGWEPQRVWEWLEARGKLAGWPKDCATSAGMISRSY